MLRCVLRSKIHLATVTESNLFYEGSITIDGDIMDQAGLIPYEQVMISNLNNGERFETYVIEGKRGSGIIALNGPTARKGMPGDRVIIFSYAYLDENELKNFRPKVLILDDSNRVVEVKQE
ncbi:MAG: aspartate 1-decarboxylase [Thermodesulfovibrionales bacterium]|nr:aspartate 1-decarboxylase [Thermodesulfovibrionales bacterium]